jgi:hypothetical protein
MIMIVIVITLIIFALLVVLEKNSYIPSWVSTLLNIALFSGSIITILYILMKIGYRDIANYDVLRPTQAPAIPATIQQTANAQANSSQSGDLFGAINIYGCVGSSCCSEGTTWDTAKSQCIIGGNSSVSSASTTETFSTLYKNNYGIYV